jgi:4-hydroxy-2-oxoheptanedioate aldolase
VDSLATRLRERLRGGAPLLGTFVKLPALESIEVVRSAGLDLAVIDGEHSQLDDRAMLALARHAAALGVPALVRTPSLEPGLINRLLEAGAAGIQLSTLRAKRERDALVSITRYAPDGTRSVSLGHPSADFGGVPLAKYLEQSRAFPFLVGQVETATTQDSLDALLPGLDAAFIGTTDLSVDVGRPGALDDPAVRGRIGEIATAASRADVPLGAWVANVEALGALRGTPLRYVLMGSDLQYLRAGLVSIATAARSALA